MTVGSWFTVCVRRAWRKRPMISVAFNAWEVVSPGIEPRCPPGQALQSEASLSDSEGIGQLEGFVIPALTRLRGESRVQPCPDPICVNLQQLSEPRNCGGRGLPEPTSTVQQMLCSVIGAISHKGFGIDDEPRLSFGTEDIAGVQICNEKHRITPLGCQLGHHAQPALNRCRIGPVRRGSQSLLRPVLHHCCKGPEASCSSPLSPRPPQKTGDHFVLFRFRPFPERRSRAAPFEQNGTGRNICLQHPDGRVTVPEHETAYFVAGLEMWLDHLEHGSGAVAASRGGNPGPGAIEWTVAIDGYIPATLESADQRRQVPEPLGPCGRAAA